MCYRPPTAVVVVAVFHINDHNSKSNLVDVTANSGHGELDETRRMSLLPASESKIKGGQGGASCFISLCRAP